MQDVNLNVDVTFGDASIMQHENNKRKIEASFLKRGLRLYSL